MRKLLIAFTLLVAACQSAPQSGLAARQVAVLKQNGFTQVGDHWELGMADRLLFGFDDAQLVAGQRERLGRLAGELARVGILGARVEGHTDSTGAEDYNLALSQRRAEAVSVAIVSGGLGKERVKALGRGEDAPIEGNATAGGRRENRRVVIIVSPEDVS